MKKILAILLLLFISFPLLFAATFTTLSMAYGYSSEENSFTFSMNNTLNILFDLNKNISIGLAEHGDYGSSLSPSQGSYNLLLTMTMGPALEIRPSDRTALNFMTGPAVMYDGSLKIAIALDASFSYFFTDYGFGLTVGTTQYPAFYPSFSIVSLFYFGIAVTLPYENWDQLSGRRQHYIVY